MKKMFFMLCAIVLAFGSLSNVKAQDFVKGKVHLYAIGDTIGDRIVIHQGETKRLVGYISVIDSIEAKNHKTVKTLWDDTDYLLEKLMSDLDKRHEAEKKKSFKGRTDTLYIVADSIAVERLVEPTSDGKDSYSRGVFLYKDGQVSLCTSSGENNHWDEALDALSYAWDGIKLSKEMAKETKVAKKRKYAEIMKVDFAFGYGYLNFSEDGLFSTPPANDPYALKWSNKWDFILKFNFFPQSCVSFSTGIGLQSNVFRFDDGFDINVFNYNPTDISKEKSKLVARYITVPLIANFRVAEHVGIHAGFLGGINYRCKHTGFKRQFKLDGETIEQSTGSHFKDFNTFKADAMFGVELYGVTFYVSHALTNMFKDSYNKEAYPFAFGILLDM